MVEKHDKVLLRKVDIVDWDSEAARQADREFKMEGIPYLRVYDGRGQFVGEVSGGDITRVESAVNKALGK